MGVCIEEGRKKEREGEGLPVDDVETVHVFESESYLSCVELRSLFREPPHFSEVEKEFPTPAVVQHEKQLVSSLKRRS